MPSAAVSSGVKTFAVLAPAIAMSDCKAEMPAATTTVSPILFPSLVKEKLKRVEQETERTSPNCSPDTHHVRHLCGIRKDAKSLVYVPQIPAFLDEPVPDSVPCVQ
jgi:hypothetical protein